MLEQLQKEHESLKQANALKGWCLMHARINSPILEKYNQADQKKPTLSEFSKEDATAYRKLMGAYDADANKLNMRFARSSGKLYQQILAEAWSNFIQSAEEGDLFDVRRRVNSCFYIFGCKTSSLLPKKLENKRLCVN